MFSSWFASFFFWEHKLVRFHFGTSIRRLLIFKKNLDYWNPQILKPGHSVLGLGEDYFHLGPKIARRSSPFSPSSPVLSSTDHRLSPGTADGPANPEAHPPLLPRSPVGVTAPGRCLAWSADPSRVQTDCFSPRW